MLFHLFTLHFPEPTFFKESMANKTVSIFLTQSGGEIENADPSSRPKTGKVKETSAAALIIILEINTRLAASRYSIHRPQQKQLHIGARMNGQWSRIMNILRRHQRTMRFAEPHRVHAAFMRIRGQFDWKPIPSCWTYTFIIARFQLQMLYRRCQTLPLPSVAL